MELSNKDKAQIQNFMTVLKISEQERQELLEYDKAVDKGTATEYELTPEQKKISKERRRAENRTYTFTQRERKADNEKQKIISKIATLFAENAVITNKEREVALTIGDNEYSITLIKHRAKKGK